MNKLLMKTSVVAIAAMLPSLANAQFAVRVDDGANQVVILDGGFGDTNANAGLIQWSGALGGTTVSFVTALSKPALYGDSESGQMDLNNVSIIGTGTGLIRFWMSDTGFGGTPGGSASLTGNIGGTQTAGESILSSYWVNTSNNGLNMGVTGAYTAASLGAGTNVQTSVFSSSAPSFSGSVSSSFATPGEFAMYQKVLVKYDGDGVVSFDSHQVAAIPEPETYAMLLAGLGLMGFVARRRQRKLAAA